MKSVILTEAITGLNHLFITPFNTLFDTVSFGVDCYINIETDVSLLKCLAIRVDIHKIKHYDHRGHVDNKPVITHS